MSKDAIQNQSGRTPATPTPAATPPAASPGASMTGPALRRLELEALHGTVARKQCSRCATVGAWTEYSKDGRTRYLQCVGCGSRDKVVVHVDLVGVPPLPTMPPAKA